MLAYTMYQGYRVWMCIDYCDTLEKLLRIASFCIFLLPLKEGASRGKE